MEKVTSIVVLVTCTEPEGPGIANALLTRRKAACVNILPGVRSFFWWQDNIDSDNESLLIIKTSASLLDEVVALVKEVHSYDVPEIIALPIVGGNQDYLEWLSQEVK